MNRLRHGCFGLLTALSLDLALGCSGASAPQSAGPLAAKTVADTLDYVNPTAGSFLLLKNTARSTPGHLVLDLVGPAGALSGVGFWLSTDSSRLVWTPVATGDPELVRSTSFNAPLLKAQASGDALQAGIYQRGSAPALVAGTGTVLASVALELRSGVALSPGSTLPLSAGRALILNPPDQAAPTSVITISVGTLSLR